MSLRTVALSSLLLLGACGSPGGSDAGAPTDVPALDGDGPTACTGCLIDGVCYPPFVTNPENPCERCRTGFSTSAWFVRAGESCDDGDFCSAGETCDASGACTGGHDPCVDTLACNGEEQCDEDADACTFGTPTCSPGTMCDAATDSCVSSCSGCFIDGVCYPSFARHPTDACLFCRPAASSTAWTANVGVSCDDGAFCNGPDACDAGGACVPVGAAPCDDGVACNGAEGCDEAANACAPGTSTCAPGTYCNAATDTCSAFCAGCLIDGVCYPDYVTNPANPCERCRSGFSTTSWFVSVGATCDDGLFCTFGDACAPSGACTGTVQTCDDGAACTVGEFCDESADACVAGTSTCATGLTCDAATDSCLLVCTGGTTACRGACVDLRYDPTNCGGCGRVCAAGPNQSAVCAMGACLAACNAGYADCGPGPGCETSTSSDPTNCGGCGVVCASGACSAGVCLPPPTTYRFTGSIERYVVPAGVTRVRITALGASGGAARTPVGVLHAGGFGASVTTEVTVAADDILLVLVGGEPAAIGPGTDGCGASGGGGSYVVRGAEALAVAGGGGGASGFSSYAGPGQDASLARAGGSSGTYAGGTAGRGGAAVSAEGGGGGGLTGDGGSSFASGGGGGGRAFTAGGAGGARATSESCAGSSGGFGGGGGGGDDLGGGGGGDGGGAAQTDVTPPRIGAGGGGSYGAGSSTRVELRTSHGAGSVTIAPL